jgi:hypothetical protein
MVDVKHKRCIHEWCNTFVSNKNYEGFCMRCYIYKYPLKLVSRNYKTKEFTVVEFVKPISPIMNGLRIKSFRTGVRVADQIYAGFR